MLAQYRPIVTISAAMFAAVVVASVFIWFGDDGSSDDKKGLLLPVIHIASEKLNRIEITNRQDQIILNAVKRKDGWFTDGEDSQKVDIKRLAALVQTLATTRIVEAMTGLATNYGEYGVNPTAAAYGSAVKIVLSAENEFSREIYLGYSDEVSGNHFVRVDDDMMVYRLDKRVPIYDRSSDWLQIAP